MSTDLPCACTALRKASRAVSRLYDERLADTGMTITQFAVLRNLARGGDMPLSRLAEVLVMERTSLYRTLAPIERSGWVAIGAGAARTRVAVLTAAGRRAMDDATAAWDATQTEIVAAIGLPDFEALQAQLGKLVAISAGLAG